jgi:hypothetical protein
MRKHLVPNGEGAARDTDRRIAGRAAAQHARRNPALQSENTVLVTYQSDNHACRK